MRVHGVVATADGELDVAVFSMGAVQTRTLSPDAFSRIAFGRPALEEPGPLARLGVQSAYACVVGALVALGFQYAHGNQMDPVTGIDGLYCRSLLEQ